jgi:hypothetical protein
MPTEFDPAEFVDRDYQASSRATYGASATPASGAGSRPPTREEVEARVGDAQAKLAELKRAQEELERERAQLEELRRRQTEFQAGREEMLQQLTRGVGLLEEAEFNARREADQTGRTLQDFREALAKVQAIRQDQWTGENYNLELTRALTVIENARMEWNSARLKFAVLNGVSPAATDAQKAASSPFATKSFAELCKLGFALTWPLVLLGGAIFLLLLFRR